MKVKVRKRPVANKGRLYFFFFIIVVFFTILLGRVYYFKTVKGAAYETEAKNQQLTRRGDRTIQPSRGAILDRNKQPMAVSTAVYNVAVDPILMQDIDDTYKKAVSEGKKDAKDIKTETINALCEVLGLDRAMLEDYYSVDPQTNLPKYAVNFKYIAKQIPREQKEALEELGVGNKTAVSFEDGYKRKYVLNTVASNVLGFIRGDNKWGLEKQYDRQMSGIPGRSFSIMKSSTSDGVVSQDMAPKDGNSIVTTLDYTMQQFAQKAVDEAMATYNSEEASAIIMDPNTAEIYAMASSPQFDGNDPTAPLALSDSDFRQKWEAMPESEQFDYLNGSWNNFNVVSTYEPGSTFKPMVIAAALEENIIEPETTFYCDGMLKVADKEIKCHLTTGHGMVDTEGAIAQSCNVAMMHIGAKMGAELFYKYQRDFGFGEKTGIDLPAEESVSSLMYTPDRIGPTELATMSFGQSFNCTPIQLMTAFSAVINGGSIMRPYVVSKIIDKQGNVISENRPQVIRKVISKETSDIVRKDMISTLTVGTGKKARIDGYVIGGKTGTAEQGDRSKGVHTISFISFLPADNPQYVAAIIIHKPEFYEDGVTTPAPFMKDILENIIKYKSLPPDENGMQEADVVLNNSAAMVDLNEYSGANLNDAIREIEALGLKYEVVGSGNTIVNQAPHGGIQVEVDSTILLYLERSEGEEAGIKVPDVRGKTYDDAVAQLTQAGFQVVFEGDNTKAVVSQPPMPDVFLEKDGEITIQMGEIAQ